MNVRRGIVLAVLVSTAVFAGAQGSGGADRAFLAAFPDNADVRSKLFSSLIGAPKELAVAFGEKEYASAAGAVLARAVPRQDDFLVEFRNGAEGGFDATTRGTCVVQRSNAKNNYILQAWIYLQDDPSCYLRLYPNPRNSGTLADLVLYGAILKQGLGVEGMMYQALVKPFTAIVESTQKSFDWAAVFPDPSGAAAAWGAPAGSRAAALSEALAAAVDFEDFASTPEARGAEEPSSIARAPAGFSSERGETGSKASVLAFPRYLPGKGIAQSALRAALYLDALDHRGAAYALFGPGIRLLVLPRFDGTGRFSPLVYQDGRELAWDSLPTTRADASLRILRLPAIF